MSAVIFSGTKLKALKNALQLASKATIYSDSFDPSVTGQSASLGDVFISTSTNLTYQKTGAGDTAWTSLSLVQSGDITPTSFLAADNQSSPANVTGLLFSNSSVRSFQALISISRGTTFESIQMQGIQKTASWDFSELRNGDVTGVTFSITNAGQIQYTSTSTGSAPTIKFRALVY